MNINNNVEKDNARGIFLIIISLLFIAGAYASYRANLVTTVNAPIQTSGMSEADRIKQKIREAETLRDAYASAQEAAAQARDFDKSAERAKQVVEQQALIKKLYDDLHEVNMKEGENGETN